MKDREFIDRIVEKSKFNFIGKEFLFFKDPVDVKILIVADGLISFTPTGFGLGLLIDTLRSPAYEYVRFHLDLAKRDGSPAENPNPGPYQSRYAGFRFDQATDDDRLIIDNYDQIWLFGFAPGNDAGPDSDIENDSRRLTETELIRLTSWMNEHQGGVLAMGDHDYLGATMCWKIPRVRHMRRWTNAQNVPPVGGKCHADTHLRHDTNQPATPGQQAGTDTIYFGAQGDAMPQTIEVKRYYVGSGPLFGQASYEPHPILCSRDYGVIDILPDHPHEGWVYEDQEVDPHTSYSWSARGESVSGDDFPVVGGHREMPEVIAWANTTPNPPYKLSKGPSPAKRFGVIGVYDGHRAHVGRVVTDATWHHWFSENLVTMKDDSDTDHYDKLQDYYRNVAVWLSRPAQQSQMLSVAAWNSMFTVQAFQELVPSDSPFVIGPSAEDVVGRRVPRCTYRRWVRDFILPELHPWRRDRLPGPVPDPICLSCPPFALIDAAALGVLIQELLPLRNEVLEHKKLSGKQLEKAVHGAFQKAVKRAAPTVLKELDDAYRKEAIEISDLAKEVKGTEPRHGCG